jgi:hypothetical protein
MIRPTNVTALSDYKIRVNFTDGMTGVLDLSPVAGTGVFAPLKDEAFFKKAYLGDHGQIAWSDEIQICPDAAYWEIGGKF